jgi:D-beta-D-heptose 7-phosphate kinase / D-beta-D-heptose 1-phosphate adenosyltransferase
VNVLVVGDVMQDEYWTGSTERISPEAPVPVVLVQHTETRPGGAANVAANARALGADVNLLGDFGPQIRKLRVMSRHQQLIRLDFEQPLVFDRKALLEAYRAALPYADVVILSDYGKGTLVDVAEMIAMTDKPVLVDPKGDQYSKYIGATMLTPNLSEFEAIVGKCRDDATVASVATGLMADMRLQALLVTRGERGMTLVQHGKPPLYLPAVAREVYDVTGAGDTVIAAMAVGLADGMGFADAARFANKAAGIKVGKLGTATVSRAELERA